MGGQDFEPDSQRANSHQATLATPQRDTITSLDDLAESDRGAELLLIVMSGSDVGRIHVLDPRRPLTVVGREETADIQVMDAEISRRHAGIRFDGKSASFVLADLQSRNGTRLNGEPVSEERRLASGDLIQLGANTVLRVTRASEPEAKYARKMHEVALRDGLTGAFNRRYLDERIVAELAYARRHRAPFALLLIDFDHFKKVNDTHGHQAGDAVLRGFHALVQSELRAEDVVGRYGGEEFVILCRDTSAQSAAIVAERLRRRVEATPFVHEGVSIPVTVSVGIAGSLELDVADPADLFRAADAALYRAKNEGRNRCHVATP